MNVLEIFFSEKQINYVYNLLLFRKIIFCIEINYTKSFKNKKNTASSVAKMIKSTSSNDSSWASITNKSLKMSIPKVDSDMSFSESGNSSPEVSYFKKFKKEEDEGMVIPEQPVYPPEIINISDDDDLSSIESSA